MGNRLSGFADVAGWGEGSMTTQPAPRDTAAGVTVPRTRLARDATELVRASTTDLIYHHSRRVFWFATLQGRNLGLSFDPELLYFPAIFHNLCLNHQFRGECRRFGVLHC